MNKLFLPITEKSLKRQYPELNVEPEFLKVTLNEMKFVWAYANKTSPFVIDESLSDIERVEKAYNYGFEGAKGDDARRADYYSFNFPERIRVAIEKMGKYSPTTRAQAKSIVETIFANFKQMVNVDMKEFIKWDKVKNTDDEGNETEELVKSIDWAGRSNYITSSVKISESLPSLIKQVEDGFGITSDASGGEEEGTTKAIHRHNSSDNTN